MQMGELSKVHRVFFGFWKFQGVFDGLDPAEIIASKQYFHLQSRGHTFCQ
jgi:hypothetical protein